MAEIITFRTRHEREKDKVKEARLFFLEQEFFLKEAKEYHEGKKHNRFDFFDPSKQTGYELTPDVLEALDDEIKTARKISMNNTENNFINSDITSNEWAWLKDWLEEEKNRKHY